VCLRERQRLAIVRAFFDIAAEASRARREAAAPG
jgi:hypothetical protein